MPDQDQLEAEVRNGASGTTSEEDLSEALDEDKLGGDFPPDEPAAAFEYGVTPQEQRVQEPISERVDREIPETPVDDVVTERSGDLSAEEAAMHVRELP